jgi:hypothetical protein
MANKERAKEGTNNLNLIEEKDLLSVAPIFFPLSRHTDAVRDAVRGHSREKRHA